MGIEIERIDPTLIFPVALADPVNIVRVDITRPADVVAYTANDVIMMTTSLTAPLSIPNAVARPGGSAFLQAITVVTDQGGGAQTWTPRIWIYQKQRATLLGDNVAFTQSLTILRDTGFQTVQTLPALTSPGGSTIDTSVLENIAILVKAAPDTRNLLFDLQTLTAFTPSSAAGYSVIFAFTMQ